MIENLHTHTTRCNHASGTEEEYIQQAIAAGLQVLGFSDHTPYRFPGNYVSNKRMALEDLEDYCTTVLSLKEKYADKIQIRLGLEVEYYPALIQDLLDILKPYPIEYMILGQHCCGNQVNEPSIVRGSDDEAFLVRYCDQVIEGMQTGLFTYFAHPDLFHFMGDDTIYRRHIARLCQTAKDMQIPLEINLSGLRGGEHYPRELFWKIAGEIGCDAVLGSDAHGPQGVVIRDAEEKALEIVDKFGLNLLEHIPVRSWRNSPLAK